MAKLREVLGGILKDIAHSRFVADSVSREYLMLYKDDPVLAQFPIPRISVKDIILRLRFAVQDQASGSTAEVKEEEMAKLWRAELTKRVLPAFLRANLGTTVTPQQLNQFTRTIIEPSARSKFSLSQALKGKTDKTITDTTARLMTGFGKLPASARRSFPNQRLLQRQTATRVRTQIARFLPKLREVEKARHAASMDLEVLVRHADLAPLPESAIQEITLTIGMDDLDTTDVAENEFQTEDE